MKKIVTIVALMLAVAVGAMAQEAKHPRFNPEEFKAKWEAFICQKAELTKEESEKILPIFEEMKAKQRELKQQEFKTKKNFNACSDEKKCQEALLKIIDIHEDFAEIEETYYKKMCKAVSAQKAYRVMLADDAFHREMLQRASNQGHKKHERPQRPK